MMGWLRWIFWVGLGLRSDGAKPWRSDPNSKTLLAIT
jgi:hypothetical protein